MGMLVDSYKFVAAHDEVFEEQQRIQASDAAASMKFGNEWSMSDYGDTSMALSDDGNTLAVGVGSAGVLGAVYVFTRSGGVWTEQQKVQASDGTSADKFGRCVALSADGNTMAVGANEDDNIWGTNGPGSVYIFTRSGGVWTEQQRVDAAGNPGGQTNQHLGASVALSDDGNTLAAGMVLYSAASLRGATAIFTRSGGVWTHQQTFNGSTAGSNDLVGFVVALSGDGDTLFHGAPESVSNGHGYVWTRSGGVWTEQQALVPSVANNGNMAAAALSNDGNTLLVSGYLNNNGFTRNGAIWEWTRSGGVWTEGQQISASNAKNEQRFGRVLAMNSDGDRAIVGVGHSVSGENAFVLIKTGGVWAETQILIPSDTAADDWFGEYVAMSGDGYTLAVAAPRDNNSGGADAGSVYVFVD